MVFLDVVLVALLAGKLVGGSLGTLADTPIKVAPAAPGKAMRLNVWPPKVCRRRTMNHPITAAVMATMVPA